MKGCGTVKLALETKARLTALKVHPRETVRRRVRPPRGAGRRLGDGRRGQLAETAPAVGRGCQGRPPGRPRRRLRRPGAVTCGGSSRRPRRGPGSARPGHGGPDQGRVECFKGTGEPAPSFETVEGFFPLNYSARVGDYRVVVELDDDRRLIIVRGIGPRKNVYDRLEPRPETAPARRPRSGPAAGPALSGSISAQPARDTPPLPFHLRRPSRGSARRSLDVVDQAPHDVVQRPELVRHDAPDDRELDPVIPVDDDVPDAGRPSAIRSPGTVPGPSRESAGPPPR